MDQESPDGEFRVHVPKGRGSFQTQKGPPSSFNQNGATKAFDVANGWIFGPRKNSPPSRPPKDGKEARRQLSERPDAPAYKKRGRPDLSSHWYTLLRTKWESQDIPHDHQQKRRKTIGRILSRHIETRLPPGGKPRINFCGVALLPTNEELGKLLANLAFLGQEKDLGTLLELGISPNMKDDKGKTALEEAISRNQKGVVEVLLRYGGSAGGEPHETRELILAVDKGVTVFMFEGAEATTNAIDIITQIWRHMAEDVGPDALASVIKDYLQHNGENIREEVIDCFTAQIKGYCQDEPVISLSSLHGAESLPHPA